MANFDSDFLAELLSGVQPIGYMEVDAPNGETYRYSDAHLDSEELGPFIDRVTYWEGFRSGVSIPEFSISAPQGRVQITDLGRSDASALRYLVARYGASLQRAVVRVGWASPTLSSSKWHRIFTGQVARISQEGTDFAVELRTPDEPLRGNLHLGYVTPEVFPDADDDSFATPLRAVYGVHDGSVLNLSHGALSCVKISSTGDPDDSSYGHRYLVGVGHYDDSNVGAAYDGDSAVASKGSAWDFVLTKRAGRWFTEVGFTSDPTNEVTVDIEGIRTGSDATGTLIEDAVDVIVHVLANWVFNRWNGDLSSSAFLTEGEMPSGGDWFDSSHAPIDTTTAALVADWLLAQGHKVTKVLTSENAESVITDWMANHQATLHWNEYGLLAFSVNDPHVEDVYLADNTAPTGRVAWPWIVDADMLSDPFFDDDPTNLVDEVLSRFAYVESDGRFYKSMQAKDYYRKIGAREPLDLTWVKPRAEGS